jgi:hypothetical protein
MDFNKEIEYDDVYVVEEKSIKVDELDENLDTELKDNLTLDSMDLSDEDDINEVAADYDKLKIASEISKRKLEKEDKKAKITEFKAKVVKREEVVEDFIRNFFTQYNLMKSLDEFNVFYF